MTNNTFVYSLPNTKQTRAGAKAFVQAMIKAEKSTKSHNKKGGMSNKEWFGLFDTSSQILLDAAGGNLSQHTIGVILTLAEFLNEAWISAFTPDPKGWKPEASLTKKQVEDKRQKFSDSFDEPMLDEKNSIPKVTSAKELRSGAKACHKAMQDIERIMGNGSNSRVNYEKKCNDSEQNMIEAAESGLSPFMLGFVIAFAQYKCVEIGGTVNLNRWIPWAAMTKEEAEADKNELWSGD